MGCLFIIGAGGHGLVVAEAALAASTWDQIVFLDDHIEAGFEIGAFSVIGPVSQLAKESSGNDQFVVAIGDNRTRVSLLTKAMSDGFRSAIIIHPSAVVSISAEIGVGSVILANSVINARATIGIGAIVNTSASIDHDCKLGQGVHVSPGAHLAGGVHVGDLSWIGIGATANPNVKIGSSTIVGASAAVVEDVQDCEIVKGVPARVSKL